MTVSEIHSPLLVTLPRQESEDGWGRSWSPAPETAETLGEGEEGSFALPGELQSSRRVTGQMPLTSASCEWASRGTGAMHADSGPTPPGTPLRRQGGPYLVPAVPCARQGAIACARFPVREVPG